MAAAVGPAKALAQSGAVSIDPGMTHEQVLTRLGSPSEERVTGSFDYMYYENNCGQKCGMDDLVILDNGIVTDAVFRSKERVFTGVSSSPHDLSPMPASHYAPAPIRAATAEDSAHRGGIVFAPRAPAQPSQYARIVPNHADSARMASPGPATPVTPPAAVPPTPPTSGVASAEMPAGAPGTAPSDTAAPR